MTNFIIELEEAVQQIKLPKPCKETAQNQATEPQPQIGFLTYSLSDASFADKNTIPWQSVNYHRVYSDVESLVQYLQAGYCFTSIFNTTNTTQTLKTYPNWYGTQCVVFDIDNVRVDVSFQEFMSRVPMKPTFAYTTRNHGLIKPEDTKPYSRFRLVYVFDNVIKNKAVYQELYNRIDALTENPNIENLAERKAYKQTKSQEFEDLAKNDRTFGLIVGITLRQIRQIDQRKAIGKTALKPDE